MIIDHPRSIYKSLAKVAYFDSQLGGIGETEFQESSRVWSPDDVFGDVWAMMLTFLFLVVPGVCCDNGREDSILLPERTKRRWKVN